MENRKYNGWIDWRYLQLNSRMRKGIKFPTRERVLIREILRKQKLRYMEIIPFYNPLYNGSRNQYPGSIQWVDFLVFVPKLNKMVAIQFDIKNRHGGLLQRKKDAHSAKIKYLEGKGIPVLVVSRYWGSQEYEIRTLMFIRKLEKQ